VALGLPGDDWWLRGPGLPLQWLSLPSPARVESPAVLQVPCIPPETVVTRVEETEQVGPVETEAEQVSLLHAPSVSPQEVSMRHSLPQPHRPFPAGGSPPITTEPKCGGGKWDGPGGMGLPREGCDTVEEWAGSAPTDRTLSSRGLFPALHSPPRSSTRTP